MEKEKANVIDSTTELDTAIEKAERLIILLTEANKLAESFCK